MVVKDFWAQSTVRLPPDHLQLHGAGQDVKKSPLARMPRLDTKMAVRRSRPGTPIMAAPWPCGWPEGRPCCVGERCWWFGCSLSCCGLSQDHCSTCSCSSCEVVNERHR